MRYTINEDPIVMAQFTTSDTVTASLYNVSTGNSVSLSATTCDEIASTGVFTWDSDNIATTPTEYTQYLWLMSNGTTIKKGKLVVGGYPDSIDTIDDNISTITTDISSIESNIATITTDISTIDDNIATITTDISSIETDVEFVKDLTGGRWYINNNQLILYKSDNTSVVATFNLYDAAGLPTMTNVVDRQRV